MDKYLEQLKTKYDTSWKGGKLEDRKAMFQLAKKVASQTGLSKEMTEAILLTIAGESGFNQFCVNWDSYDYGLCQFSKKYYCKEYNMTPQECIEQPERQLRIMCANFKAGRQSNWIAYTWREQHRNQLTLLDTPAIPSKPADLEEKRTAIKNAEVIVPEVTISNTPSIVETKTEGWIMLVLHWLKLWYSKVKG